jgi:hypothetical protein
VLTTLNVLIRTCLARLILPMDFVAIYQVPVFQSVPASSPTIQLLLELLVRARKSLAQAVPRLCPRRFLNAYTTVFVTQQIPAIVQLESIWALTRSATINYTHVMRAHWARNAGVAHAPVLCVLNLFLIYVLILFF